MYKLAIIPLPGGGVDYTVLDSTEEEVLIQGTILAADLTLVSLQGIFPSFSPEDHARILEKMSSLNEESDAEEMEIPEF